MTAAEPQCVRFVLDGETVLAPPLPPTTTLLDYLREVAGRTGTKEGCAEGDCGACTVVLGRPRAGDDGIDWRAVNSCIRLLPTIDGCELVTVESLAVSDGELHPVQQALVDGHASQCGFCTPGFVMSLFAHYLQHETTTRESLIDALAGNLCRCTGYRPIIDAGVACFGLPAPQRWSRADAQAPPRLAALRAIRREQAMALPGFTAPRTIDQFAAARRAEPEALILAGGTDVGLWVTQQLRELPPILYIGEVAELATIDTAADGSLAIGAAVNLTDAWAAIVALYPALAELARRFASPPVCNAGTLCGNIANGSPIGDSMPALLALDARLRLRCGTATRELPLDLFYLGYQKTALARGEFITLLLLPAPQPGWRYAAYKVAKRIDQDISAVCAAFAVQIERDVVVDARLAFGGMAAIPKRAAAAEAALRGCPWSATGIEAAIAALATDFQPLDDLRASAGYRTRAAGNLLRRFQMESTARPLRTHDVSLQAATA